jgi:hypothetical protein
MNRLCFSSARRNTGACPPPPTSPPPERRADFILARLEPVAHSLAAVMSAAWPIERARRAHRDGGGTGHPPGALAHALARRRAREVAALVEQRMKQGLSLPGAIGIYKPRIVV